MTGLPYLGPASDDLGRSVARPRKYDVGVDGSDFQKIVFC